MSNAATGELGAVVSLWRYPVKSMLGEELNTASVSDDGFVGDRAYALLDRSDGKVGTAKNPRKWPNLFAFRAMLVEQAGSGATAPPVQITLPDGTIVTSIEREVDQVLSKALKREVRLAASERSHASREQPAPASGAVLAEQYWPDMEGLESRDAVTDFELPAGTFFDCATLHLLTTATLDRLRQLHPNGQFALQRFRPNIVVERGAGEPSFAENAWIGRTVDIGDEVRLRITAPCGRCVMTTLAQGDLPADREILRTAMHHNQGRVGVYAAVVRGGTIRRGDRVRLH